MLTFTPNGRNIDFKLRTGLNVTEEIKMSVITKLEAKAKKELDLNSVTITKKYNQVLERNEYCITGKNGHQCENWLASNYADSVEAIENMTL